MASSREVKRLEAVTRSPVYAMFSASIKGLPTIRAFGATKRFRQTFLDALDLNGSWWIAYINCARCSILITTCCRVLPGSPGRVMCLLLPLPDETTPESGHLPRQLLLSVSVIYFAVL